MPVTQDHTDTAISTPAVAPVDDPIAALANLRGEQREQTERYLKRTIEKLVPKRLIDPAVIAALPIVETGLDWPYAYVRLESGRTLYSWPSNPTRLRQYWMIRDRLPKTVNANTFGAATDVARRYASVHLPAEMTGSVVIEGGAYIGLKAIRFAELIGSGGKVIAVEIDPANHDLMRLNIEANGLGHIIEPVHAGLGAKDGTGTMNSNGRQRHSLSDVDGINVMSRKDVPTLTLDTLIDQRGLGRIGYLNIQVNGHEADVLDGCQRHAASVENIHIANHDRLGGPEVRARVLDWLARHGFSARESAHSIAATSS